ncbi:Acetylornithine deacetylase [Castellaniella caeni]
MNELTINTVKILRELVGFDTTTRGSNLKLIEFVEDYLAGFGVRAARSSSQPDRCNLFATIGPEDQAGVMLAGHTDVVPVTGQHWQSDPFSLTLRDDRYYGRGTADMKGFIAAVLAAVPHFQAQNLKLPVHLAFSYDEEVGCVGVRDLVSDLAAGPIRPRWGIIGEPTSMQPVSAHKGKVAFRVHVTGFAAHSRNPKAGVSAITAAVSLIDYIQNLAEEILQTGQVDSAYEYPGSSLHVGTIHGGTALNIVPAQCHFDFEIRYLPEVDVRPIVARIQAYASNVVESAMRARQPDCSVHFETLSDYPGMTSDAHAEPVATVCHLLGADATGKVSFGTEGGLYQRDAGIPCVVCGPGSMAQGHRPDEYVTADQLDVCGLFLRKLARHLAFDF